MPYYLVQSAFTPEGWAAMVKKPQNREEAIRPVVERMGGKLKGAWMSFGEQDTVLLCEMPDNLTAAGFAMAVAASGALKSVKTTPLFSFAEGMEAMKRAAKSGYQPPK